ncbi:MAG: hypothetical protein QM503_05730 [Bacteroidota bacterium]
MKLINTFIKIFTITILVFLVVSCNPEKKLAIDFVYGANSKNILVLTPDYLFKKNLKTYLMDSLEIRDDENKDSLLLLHSDFLNDLNDSLFIANYVLGYTKSLSNFGFNVFTQKETEQFLLKDSNSFQVNIAQIELEETLYTFRDEEIIFDNRFYHDHNLNAIYINSWFEISNLDDNNSSNNIYFSSDMITDIADGIFDYDIFSNQIRYMYNLDSLEQDVLYAYAYRLGLEYAGYTFDLLLNNKLNKELAPGVRSTKYWRYDPINHNFYIATDDKFILLDE